MIDQPALLDEGALCEVIKDGLGHRDGVPGIPQRGFRSTVSAALDQDA